MSVYAQTAALIHASCAHACRALQARLFEQSERITSSLAYARESQRRIRAMGPAEAVGHGLRVTAEAHSSRHLLRIVLAQALDDLRGVVRLLPRDEEMRAPAEGPLDAGSRDSSSRAVLSASAAALDDARHAVARLSAAMENEGAVGAASASVGTLMPGLEFVVLDAVRKASEALEIAAQSKLVRAELLAEMASLTDAHINHEGGKSSSQEVHS